MIKKPLYSFNHIDDVGINRVPLDNAVLLEDDGAGGSKFLFLKSKAGIGPTTTMSDLINSLPGNWDELGGGTGEALEVIYDNTTSGLTATDLQAAIDELDAYVDTAVQQILPGVSNVQAEADINTALGL